MSNKNETPSKSTSNPVAEPKTTEVKPEQQQTDSGSAEKPFASVSNPTELSKEVVELVMELRDTVKRIDPKKHTTKTLRRSLSNVRDILDDIDKYYAKD
ncbi:MAG: hypothetical protein ABL933_02665 [Methyloglobulus sp.]|nr:hypothetical protein [Methyloglobulus sp.]